MLIAFIIIIIIIVVVVVASMGGKILQKNLGARRVTCSKYHTEDPHIYQVPSYKIRSIWHPCFVHPILIIIVLVYYSSFVRT